jgi:hypothetical protein
MSHTSLPLCDMRQRAARPVDVDAKTSCIGQVLFNAFKVLNGLTATRLKLCH